ncbi:MAG: porin family protein [Opitutaceae bacterium]|jgi:hypothetical protein|nr:porin family protein [Opitutaceae bacterium]
MKKTMFWGLMALCAVSLRGVQAPRYVEPAKPQGFFRAGMGAVIPGNGYWSGHGAFGAGLEGGARFGGGYEHEVSLGVSCFGWQETYSTGSQGRWRGTYREEFTPFLLGYAYHLKFGRDGGFGFYAGPLAGVTVASASEADDGGWFYWGDTWSSDSRAAFSWGGQAGVRWVFNKWFELSAGYRFLRINGGTLTTWDYGVVRTPALNTHAILIGFGGRF